MDKPLLNGTIYEKEYVDRYKDRNVVWNISWEADRDYRHWCIQRQVDSRTDDLVVVIMLNPGSLSKDGRELSQDLTLRILRRVFKKTPYGCLVLNLFDLATTKPDILLGNRWKDRDKDNSPLIHETFSHDHIVAAMFAYGDYENTKNTAKGKQIKERILYVDESLKDISKIETPSNPSGSPKHPRKWQFERLVDELTKCINNKLPTPRDRF